MLNKSSFFGKRDNTPAPRHDTPTPRPDATRPAAVPPLPPLGAPARGSTGGTTTPPVPVEVAKAPPKPEPASQALGGNRLIVGPDVKLKGAEILDCDTLVVEGRVEATMDSRVMLIAEKGVFSGKVSIDVAEVYGTFEGELTARQQLVIHATGRVSGTIRYGKILIDEGGELSGDIQSLEADAPVLSRSTTPAPGGSLPQAGAAA